MNKAILLLAFLVLLIPFAFAQNEVTVVVFYGEGCPHCASALEFLNELKNKYESLILEEYEVYFNQENRELFYELTEAYDSEVSGVPTIFVNEKIFNGFSTAQGESIENEIKNCLETTCQNPLDLLNDGKSDTIQKLTIPAVLGAAAIDAINPCAFAVLIILLTTILISGHKKRALYSGFSFSLAIFISYFLMGLGLYSAIQASGITNKFFIIVSVLAILLGLLNMKDFFFYGKGILMEVPQKWRPRMKKLIKSVTSIPGAFLIGLIVSLFLLPCTSGPYIVILGLLAQLTTRDYALLLLLLYNLIFILPMIIITLAVYFGLTNTEKAENWRQKKLKLLHLIAGLVLLLLGIGMIIAIHYGLI